MPLCDNLLGVVGVQGDLGGIDLEGRNGTDIQVWEISHDPPINPPFYFAVVLARRVGFDHHLVAIPSAPFWQKVR
jgi:hypothetical protein